MKLKRWALVYNGDDYIAPKCQEPRLCGKVYGDPRFSEGCHVITSTICEVHGKEVTTFNGNTYELEEPDPEYVRWCRDNKHFVPTTEQPILIIEDEEV